MVFPFNNQGGLPEVLWKNAQGTTLPKQSENLSTFSGKEKSI